MTIGSFLEKKKIRAYIQKYNMLEKGDSLVIGLSGGPDSVCLFFVLLALREEYDLKITAVHVNHMIRGEAADADQAFVRELCKKHDIDLVAEKIDIPSLALENGRSLEEEARLARYSLFEKVRQDMLLSGVRSSKIAIAHNADDNAETVLFHMARGCGLEGICGISPVRENIIRPLLAVSKADIVDFLDGEGISYCIDATNSDVDYDRNRIRHNIMPQMCQVNSRALDHICQMTEKLQEVSAYIGKEADALLAAAKKDNGLLRSRLLEAHPLVQATALKHYLSSYMPEKKDVSQIHIDQACALLSADGEKRLDLPHGRTLVLSYDLLYVEENSAEAGRQDIFGQAQEQFEFRDFPMTEGLTYPQNTYTKWFDYDKISSDVVIRTRQPGDYLVINSQGDKKSIKDYFVNEKIPRSMRDSQLLVCDGSHVMWVVGHRISSYYKISEATSRVLEITCEKG